MIYFVFTQDCQTVQIEFSDDMKEDVRKMYRGKKGLWQKI